MDERAEILWGFFFFPFWRKRAEAEPPMAGPKLLLDIWGVMISAGRDAIPWAVRLHSEVCLHGLTRLWLFFPFGDGAASTGHQTEVPSIQRGSPSKTEEQGDLSASQENRRGRPAEGPRGAGADRVFPEEVCGRRQGEEPGAEAVC